MCWRLALRWAVRGLATGVLWSAESIGGSVMDASENRTSSKNRELMGFLFLTVVLAPVLSAAVVGGYGFLIWMYQLIAGPPTS